MAGTVYERVLRTQEVDVQALDGSARVVAPVTDRGDAIGLLELVLPGEPAPASIGDVAAAAHAGLRRRRRPPLHRRVRVGTADQVPRRVTIAPTRWYDTTPRPAATDPPAAAVAAPGVDTGVDRARVRLGRSASASPGSGPVGGRTDVIARATPGVADPGSVSPGEARADSSRGTCGTVCGAPVSVDDDGRSPDWIGR
jgi:hypothetical protein